MKFIHAADLHLDSPLRGLAGYDGAVAQALQGATRRAFENLVQLAIDEQVDFVLIAGDLYDGAWQDFSTGIFFANKIGELDRAGIRVFAVVGNHDFASPITKALERPQNLTLFASKKASTVQLEDLGVAIHGQSFGRRHVDGNLAKDFPRAIPGLFNIGLLHTSLDGREGHAVYAPCHVDDLLSRGYQYWALGHVHQAEILHQDPWVVFPGCVQGRHARETGAKGCVLVTAHPGQAPQVEQRSLDVVRWSRCVVDLSAAQNMDQVLSLARQALAVTFADAEGRCVAVRMQLSGATVVHEAVQGRAYWLKHKFAELAAEIDDSGLWIEKLELATAAKTEPTGLLTGDSGLGALARNIADLPARVDAIVGLDKVLATLMNKLPADIFLHEGGLQLEDPVALERLIEEAKELCLQRLIEVRGEG